MHTVIDLDDDILDRARPELGTTKKDPIHEALPLPAERGARGAAIDELLSRSRLDRPSSTPRLGPGCTIPLPDNDWF
jgi:hypothetical protein